MDSKPRQSSDTRRRKVFAVLPTLLTLGNAVCGFGAITILARVGPSETPSESAIVDRDVTSEQRSDTVPSENLSVEGNLTSEQPTNAVSPTAADRFSARMEFFSEQLWFAAGLIFLAMLFDALDGSAARLTNQTSDFGAQLDSLCDVISFGIAPAFMMLKLTHPDHRLMNSVVDPPFHYPPRFLWPIATLFVLCAVMRLARFNGETDDDDSHEGFSGLPSPAAAGVIAAMPIGIRGLKKLLEEESFRWVESVQGIVLPTIAVLLPFITLATASLMVSRIPYPHVFNQLVRGDRGRRQLLKIVFVLVLVVANHEIAIPVLFCWFAFGAPARVVWTKYVRPGLPGRLGTHSVTD